MYITVTDRLFTTEMPPHYLGNGIVTSAGREIGSLPLPDRSKRVQRRRTTNKISTPAYRLAGRGGRLPGSQHPPLSGVFARKRDGCDR